MAIKYDWANYMSFNKIKKLQNKYDQLFAIRDKLIQADNEDIEKVRITFECSQKDTKEVIVIAGNLHYLWVIDYVVEKEKKITLLYRNCRHNRDVSPAELWREFI